MILRELEGLVKIKEVERSIIRRSLDNAVTDAAHAYLKVEADSKEQFVALLTHDLRNPLTSIIVASDSLKRSLTNERRISELSSRISKSAKRIDQMISDILDVSKSKLGHQLDFSFQSVDLTSLCEGVLNVLDPDQSRNIEFEREAIVGVWEEKAIVRVIENLLSNAIKYGDESKPIRLKIKEDNKRVFISVHNFGTPIPQCDLGSIFESFKRSDATHKGKKAGWGLGLSLVKAVAEGHGGSAIVDSCNDKGTTFTVDIPLDSSLVSKRPQD